ncbi:MAG: HEPN domain-containing protein [Candidatus Caldarchaeum sp.]|nr:HEPN domain-containing protein [Candidatus Caldarchaeum sp.]MDW8435374.1 HEPN domain-containing protein [Candidatus Caldarchaeum sp.]
MRRAADWMRQAKADLLNTSNYAWSCFASHQATEKALKAVLEDFGHPRTGNDLVELVNEVDKLTPAPREVKDDSRILNRYYITSLCPNAFPGGAPSDMFDETDAEDALWRAEKIVAFAGEATELA